jgi:acyl-CoA thioesterase-1
MNRKRIGVFALILCIVAAAIAAGVLLIPKKNVVSNQQTDKKTEVETRSKTIVAFGDSLTAGYGLPTLDRAYPAILERKLKQEGYDYKVVNAGVSGETTAGGLRRVDWVLNVKPDIVILELGANDALRGLPASEAKKNLSEIIEKIKPTGAEILLAGMYAPRNLGDGYFRQFDNVYPELAAQYNLKLIPFFLNEVALVPELNIDDGVHPNEEGYKIIVNKNVWPYLQPMLKK